MVFDIQTPPPQLNEHVLEPLGEPTVEDPPGQVIPPPPHPPQLHPVFEQVPPQLSIQVVVVSHAGAGALHEVTVHAHVHPVFVHISSHFPRPVVVVPQAGVAALHDPSGIQEQADPVLVHTVPQLS